MTTTTKTSPVEVRAAVKQKMSWPLRVALALDGFIVMLVLVNMGAYVPWWERSNPDAFYRGGDPVGSVMMLLIGVLGVFAVIVFYSRKLQQQGKRMWGTVLGFLGIPVILGVAWALPYIVFNFNFGMTIPWTF